MKQYYEKIQEIETIWQVLNQFKEEFDQLKLVKENNQLDQLPQDQLAIIQQRLIDQRQLLLEEQVIDEQCELREDVINTMIEVRDELRGHYDKMAQRHNQLTNPQENQDQIYI